MSEVPYDITLPCTGKTDLFFSTNRKDITHAKALCMTCPFKAPCREMGLRLVGRSNRGVMMGIWGGVNVSSEHARIARAANRRAKRLGESL